MKRIVCAMLAASLVVSLAACNSATTAGGSSETAVEKVEEGVEDVAEGVEEGAEDVAKDVEEGVETVVSGFEVAAEDIADDFETIAKDAKERVESLAEVTEEDVRKAIDYIEEHAEEAVEDSAVAKQVAHYACCLKYWTEGVEHDVADFAEKAYDFAKKVFETAGQDVREGVDDALTALKDVGEKIDEAKDNYVTEVHELVAEKNAKKSE